MQVYLIRHGEKKTDSLDPQLTNAGIRQAEQTGKFLQTQPLQKIVHSPTVRTVQTANIISGITGMYIVEEPLLRERMDWYDDPGLSRDAFRDIWRKSQSDRDWQPPIGMSSRSAGQRLEAAVKKHADSKLSGAAFVTHGGIISDFLKNVIGNEIMVRDYPDYVPVLENGGIPECSITTLTYENDSWKLVGCFDTGHLKNF